jgi:hypothetical protein
MPKDKFDFSDVDFSKEYNGRIEFDSLEEMDAYFCAYSEAEALFKAANNVLNDKSTPVDVQA